MALGTTETPASVIAVARGTSSGITSTTGSRTTSSRSMHPPSPEDVDWEALSPRGTWILQRIALPRSLGLSYIEIARSLDRPKPYVIGALDELARELARQGNVP